MTAKQFLSQIKIYEESVLTMRAKLFSTGAIDYAKDRVQTSPSDTMAENMIRYSDLCERYETELKRRVSMITEIKSEYAAVLLHKYINGLSWFAIADKLGYSVDTIIKYHGLALREFSLKFPEIEKL